MVLVALLVFGLVESRGFSRQGRQKAEGAAWLQLKETSDSGLFESQ